MQFRLNGEIKVYDGDLDLPLLSYLREISGITSAKDGCAPQAACGSCAVQLNNKAVLSCVTKMSKVAKGEVTTTEGLSEYRQRVYANAFVTSGGVQCGFCIPGIVMQSHVLINNNPDPTRASVEVCTAVGFLDSFTPELVEGRAG